MMVVMVPLAKCHERDKPAVSAGIRCAVRLPSPQMANRINAKCRVEHGECAPNAGEEKAADSTHDAVVEKADEKSACQTGEDQERVMLVLPDRNGIVRDARRIFGVGMLIRGKEPSAVAMPESQLRVVRIFDLVAMCVMSQMIGRPFDG